MDALDQRYAKAMRELGELSKLCGRALREKDTAKESPEVICWMLEDEIREIQNAEDEAICNDDSLDASEILDRVELVELCDQFRRLTPPVGRIIAEAV